MISLKLLKTDFLLHLLLCHDFNLVVFVYSNPSFIAGVTFQKWPAISEIREIENLLNKTY